jgi:hypothetical protein
MAAPYEYGDRAEIIGNCTFHDAMLESDYDSGDRRTIREFRMGGKGAGTTSPGLFCRGNRTEWSR